MIKNIKKYIEETKNISLEPKKFFKNIKKEKTISKSFRFLTILTVIVFLFLTYYYINQINAMLTVFASLLGIQAPQIEVNFYMYAFMYILLSGLYLIISFLRFYIIHLFVIMFKGRYKYYQTYKALSYSLAPENLSRPLFVCLFVIIPIAILTKNVFVIILAGIIGLAIFIIDLYTVYLRAYALSELQEISMIQSFLTIYIFGNLLLVFILVVFSIITGLVFGIILTLNGITPTILVP